MNADHEHRYRRALPSPQGHTTPRQQSVTTTGSNPTFDPDIKCQKRMAVERNRQRFNTLLASGQRDETRSTSQFVRSVKKERIQRALRSRIVTGSMKYFFFIAGAALVGFSLVGQGASNPALKGAVSGLQSAKSLTVKFNVTHLPAAPQAYTLSYSKPDRYRIESPEHLVVCDGKLVRVLDKAANTYSETPVGIVPTASPELAAWAAFFDPKFFAEAKAVTPGAKRKIKGVAVTELAVTLPGKVVTLYIDDKTGMPRGASVQLPMGDKTDETLSLAEEMTVGAEALADDTFAFVPPPGAKLYEAPKVEAVPYAKVQAIFDRSCTGCHGSSGGLSLNSHASVMAGRAVAPGNPQGSKLVQYISGSRPRMPKNAPPLSAADVKTVSDWIAGGAKNE